MRKKYMHLSNFSKQLDHNRTGEINKYKYRSQPEGKHGEQVAVLCDMCHTAGDIFY